MGGIKPYHVNPVVLVGVLVGKAQTVSFLLRVSCGAAKLAGRLPDLRGAALPGQLDLRREGQSDSRREGGTARLRRPLWLSRMVCAESGIGISLGVVELGRECLVGYTGVFVYK